MRIKLLNPFLPIFSWEKIGILNGEKMKNENEKTISLTNGIWRKAGNEIMKNVLTNDESTANSYCLLIRGNSLKDLSVTLTQRGYFFKMPIFSHEKIDKKGINIFILQSYKISDCDLKHE